MHLCTFSFNIIDLAFMETEYPQGNSGISKIMLTSLFIDEWNIFSISMISIFVEHSLRFGTTMLGLVTGATIGGASIGSVLGGYMVDRFGRRKLFFFNLILFLISAILSALSINLTMLVIFRFLAGIPAGADIANVYSYIMETEKPGHREVTGAYNTLMASVAILGLNGSVVILLISGLKATAIWKIAILIQIIPVLFLLLSYKRIPESDIWKASNKEATYIDFFRKLRHNRVQWRTSMYSWCCGIASGIEVGTFAFFIPYIILKFGISGAINDRFIIIGIYSIGIPAGYLGPKILPKIGLRKLSYSGFALSFAGLVISGLALLFNIYIVLPVSMMIFVWGNHWNNEPITTSQALVADSDMRGKAVGISNFIYQLPSFLSISIFPIMFSAIGMGYSTLVVAIASFAGIIITLAVFNEIFGYRNDATYDSECVQS